MGRCLFRLLSTFFEMEKYEWHSSYLSNQLEKKLGKHLVNSWKACIILVNYLFILDYSYSSFNCCPKKLSSYLSTRMTYWGRKQLSYLQTCKFSERLLKWVRNHKSLALGHQTNLFDESVQWKVLSGDHSLKRNHSEYSLERKILKTK